MPRIVRDADVAWEGNLARGHGAMTAATSGAFIGLSYSLPTRIGDPEGKTSPEELLAAAHGGCFTMYEVEGRGHLIVHSALEVHASVPDLSEDAFAAAVEAAHNGCSFSTLLRDAGVSIDIQTTLES